MPWLFFNSLSMQQGCVRCTGRMWARMCVCIQCVCVYIRTYSILLQLGGCRPLPESETNKSFLYADERLFHLEQKHCQKGKHAIGHRNYMAPVHEHGSIALHYSSTWKSSLPAFLEPKGKEKKTPSSAWAANSTDFWTRNLVFMWSAERTRDSGDTFVFHWCFFVPHDSVFTPEISLGDWLCMQKLQYGEGVNRNGNSKVNRGIWGSSDGISGFNHGRCCSDVFQKAKSEYIKDLVE